MQPGKINQSEPMVGLYIIRRDARAHYDVSWRFSSAEHSTDFINTRCTIKSHSHNLQRIILSSVRLELRTNVT